jgi:4-amino-4-deoxy-L-arabinose transferase-like glycosyltransferase
VTRSTFVMASTAVVILAAALRLPGLDAQNLWSDEVYSIESARWPVGVLLTVQDGHPPLYGLLIKGLDRIRPSDLNGRLISAVAGIATVAAMLLLGRAIDNRRTALLGALLLAIAPLHVWYSREGRMYACAVLCSVVASWLFVTALRRGGIARWLAYAMVSLAGLFTHYLYGTIILAQTAFVVLVRLGDRAVLRRVAIVDAAVAAVAVLALAVVGLDALDSTGGQRGFAWIAVPYTAYAFVGGFGFGPPLEALHRGYGIANMVVGYRLEVLTTALVALALCWAAARALPALREGGVYLVVWLLLPALVVFTGAWWINGAYNVRYLLVTLPAFVLLAAAGIAHAPRWYAAGCLLLLAAIASVSIARDLSDPRYAREDLRGTARYLSDHADPTATVTVSAKYMVEVLRHYRPPQRVEPLPKYPVQSAEDADAILAQLRDSGRWLVLSRDWEDDPHGYFNRAIASRYAAMQVAEFPGVRVFHFDGAARP